MSLYAKTEPFDQSTPPPYGTVGYSGRRGERVVLVRDYPGDPAREPESVVIFEGNSQLAHSLADSLNTFFGRKDLCSAPQLKSA